MNGAKAEAAYEIGKLAVDVVRRDLRPSQIVTKRGGRERRGRDRRHRRLDERRPPPRRDRARVRHRLHDRRLRPHLGRDADRRRHEAVGPLPRNGRLPRRRRRRSSRASWRRARSCTRASPTVDGRTLAEVAEAVEETAGQDVVVPIETPLKSRGGIAILRGNLAPEGCVVKLAGHDRTRHRGPARVFDSEEDVLRGGQGRRDRAGRRGRDPLRGPGRRAGHARDAARHRRDRRRGLSATRSHSSPTAASRARRTASWSATSRPRRSAAARSRRCARATRS